MKNEQLDDGNVPPAQKEGSLGSTPQEGGDATKDAPNGSGSEFGSGNRRKDTSGATESTEGAEEGLEGDAPNMGSEMNNA